VKACAQAHGIAVHQPLKLDEEALALLAKQRSDVLVVVAYGLLLPPAVLALPRLGCINVHASLLPRWRGAAPIERAILAGDQQTGVCIMQMDAGLDTGPVLGCATTPITSDDSTATLTSRLVALGCSQLDQVLEHLADGTATAVPQDDALACYAHKLRKEEAAIDWQQSAAHIHNQVRAFYPRSPAWCLHAGKRLRIISARHLPASHQDPPGTVLELAKSALRVACKPGLLEITRVQPEGRPEMTLADLLNGHPGFITQGTVLESAAVHDQ
jgi:methionyl-tRNA formyltransferase